MVLYKIYIHDRLPLSCKNGGNPVIFNNMDELEEH